MSNRSAADKTEPETTTLKPRVIVIVILIFAALFTLGAIVSHALQKDGTVLNYTDCVHAKGSTVQKTFPEVCITKNGTQYANPAQQMNCGKVGWSSTSQLCR